LEKYSIIIIHLQRNYGALALVIRASLKRECRDSGLSGDSTTVPAAVIANSFLKFLATVLMDGKAFKKGVSQKTCHFAQIYSCLIGLQKN